MPDRGGRPQRDEQICPAAEIDRDRLAAQMAALAAVPEEQPIRVLAGDFENARSLMDRALRLDLERQPVAQGARMQLVAKEKRQRDRRGNAEDDKEKAFQAAGHGPAPGSSTRIRNSERHENLRTG